MELQVIRQKIYEIRGQKVMLDFDLAGKDRVQTRLREGLVFSEEGNRARRTGVVL